MDTTRCVCPPSLLDSWTSTIASGALGQRRACQNGLASRVLTGHLGSVQPQAGRFPKGYQTSASSWQTLEMLVGGFKSADFDEPWTLSLELTGLRRRLDIRQSWQCHEDAIHSSWKMRRERLQLGADRLAWDRRPRPQAGKSQTCSTLA